jgi:hypothetical protein
MMMMRRQVGRSLVVGLAVIVGLGLGVLAQSISLTVTAYSDAVRFSAQGSVKELRVEVLSLSGQKVFDSGPVLGNALDWKLLNTQGQPVANGVYLYTVTVKDPFGNVTKKLGKLAVLRGKGVAAPPLSGITVGELADEKFRLAPQAFNATDWFVSNRLGVGTDTPSFDLQVQKNVNGTTRINVVNSNTGANALADVAIGTGVGQSYALQKFGSGFSAFSWSGIALANWARFRSDSGVAGLIFTTGGASPLVFGTSDAERMRITPTGNVGIGTSSPSAQTHINNTANQPALRIDSSAGTNALEIYNTEGGQNLIFRVERTTGNVYADGNFTGNGADVAERIDVSEAVEPGDVVEIDPDNPGKFRKAREALSTRVAGVISTAPGVVLGNQRAESNDARPILALAGRVPVKVTAKYGAIAVGDLLVSSPIPGYAMKCPEKSQCIGAVIGKALEPLAEGVGMIEVQVMLR